MLDVYRSAQFILDLTARSRAPVAITQGCAPRPVKSLVPSATVRYRSLSSDTVWYRYQRARQGSVLLDGSNGFRISQAAGENQPSSKIGHGLRRDDSAVDGQIDCLLVVRQKALANFQCERTGCQFAYPKRPRAIA
jgi:hypothetical protein